MPLLVAPNGADNTLARRASVLGGLTTTLSATRPSSVGGGLASRLAADISSTTRLEAATPTPAHRAALRELDDVRRNSYDVDGFIDHLRRVNGNVECDAASWSSHDTPASVLVPRAHPGSHSWSYCSPCPLNPRRWARTLFCGSPTM